MAKTYSSIEDFFKQYPIPDREDKKIYHKAYRIAERKLYIDEQIEMINLIALIHKD